MNETYLPGSARERILDLMKHGKVTQKELAQRIDITESALAGFSPARRTGWTASICCGSPAASESLRIFFLGKQRSRIERNTKSWSWVCLPRRRGIFIPEECAQTS